MALSERSPIRVVESPQTLTDEILMKTRALCSVGAFRPINGIGATAGCRDIVSRPVFATLHRTSCMRISHSTAVLVFCSINGIGATAGCRGTVRDDPAFRYATPRSHTGCKRLNAVTPSNGIILCSALCGFDPTLISARKRNGTKIGPKRDGSHKNEKNASEICDFHRVRG